MTSFKIFSTPILALATTLPLHAEQLSCRLEYEVKGSEGWNWKTAEIVVGNREAGTNLEVTRIDFVVPNREIYIVAKFFREFGNIVIHTFDKKKNVTHFSSGGKDGTDGAYFYGPAPQPGFSSGVPKARELVVATHCLVEKSGIQRE